MRYQVKWNNGFWKVFDTVNYKDVAMHLLEVDAVDHVKFLNKE
jgi:hypothetical protein